MLARGSVPKELILCTVIPLPKDKNINVTDSVKYRGIALSFIYSKMLDLIILSRYGDKFGTSELQFEFKRKRSTNICTMVLKETLSYYANNDETVYCTFLDATKAFDRVDCVKRFKLLVDRMLPPVSVRLLLYMYTSHVCRVSWNGGCSVRFFCFKWCQARCSYQLCTFLCIYFDKLLDKLTEAGVGCYIGNIFVGALAYADDIVLLVPTARAIRLMLGICDHYALEYSFLFNAKKTNCI